jgi:hypothetical protein
MARGLDRNVWPAGALIVVATAGFAAAVVAGWPGHFPPDAIFQLAQGRSNVFSFAHPPVMAWLLGLADKLTPDAGAFMVMDVALFFTGIAALALAVGARWRAVAVLALLCASPLVLIYQGLVVKDVFFADAMLGAFAAIAWAGRLWPKAGARIVLCTVAILLLLVAALTRQNGAAAAAVGVFTLGWTAWARAERGGRARAFLGVAAAAGLLLVGAGVAAMLVFQAHSDRKPEITAQWMTLRIWDLSGAVHADPTLGLPVLHREAPGVEHFVRRTAAPMFDPKSLDSMAVRMEGRFDPAKVGGAVSDEWRRLILKQPGLYLETRWRDFWQVFGTPDVKACAPVLVGVDPGDPDMLADAGLKARETDKDDWDSDYAQAFLGTPLFSHPFYAVLAALLLLWALWDVARGRPEMIAAAGLLLAAFAFSASFFVITIACDYRYILFLDVAAMAALVQRLAFKPVSSGRAPRSPPRPKGRSGRRR